MPGGADRGKDLEKAGLMRGASTEIPIDGRAQRLDVVVQQGFERLEGGDAFTVIEARTSIARAALALERVGQGR
jgi:hypothetical protein